MYPDCVRMYVCGPTVYDLAHLGHARCYVVWDTVVRYLRFKDMDVKHVRNYTDVDDKIIKRALEEGSNPTDLAASNIMQFDEDMARLGVERPEIAPKVTDHMEAIIALIERLVESGAAYVSAGDVYFSVKSFKGYGKLSGRQIEKLRSGARVDPGEHKRDPLDFALWKTAKPGEPAWSSPWGDGRPGWHIECSAMAMAYLGETLDIHAGGADLIFPHHENEIAQSEAVTQKPFARYWMHNGFVNVDEEKMSKSLGNFFTVRDVLERHDPQVLRYLLLSVHYRSPINFAEAILSDSRRRVRYQYETLQRAERTLKSLRDEGETVAKKAGESLLEKSRIEAIRRGFVEAMDDDFNTAGAFGALSDAFTLLNELCDMAAAKKKDRNALAMSIGRAREELLDVTAVLGLLGENPESWLKADESRQTAQKGIDPDEVDRLLAERNEARKSRDFARADAIRDELAAKGVSIKDTPQGTEWTT